MISLAKRISPFVILCFFTGPARADLPTYVKQADDAFAWELEANRDIIGGKVLRLKLTSQVWQDITWKHQLYVCEPADVKYDDTMLLVIAGGRNGREPRDRDYLLGMGLARLCGGRVAVLAQVPNQPLLGDRVEDDLISETFVRYLDTGDEGWPLLFPMVKSAVRSMDALQAWANQERDTQVKRFVITGGSKRGWTTWLTGAVDDRAAAIAPMVIDTLNIPKQIPNQLRRWGKFSEQIADYTRRGLVQPENQTPKHQRLWSMVDPYTFRAKLTMPKLIILGTNDRYWTLRALDNYWDGLKGPKWVVYVPGAGHGLQPNVHYALNGAAALFRHTASGKALPELSWQRERPDGALRIRVTPSPAPKKATLWTARAATKDFREASWQAAPMRRENDSYVGEAPLSNDAFVAVLGDLEFEIDGLSYHLSTQIHEGGGADPKRDE
jgi:PhoPQ-activated pathogenicity-related protein